MKRQKDKENKKKTKIIIMCNVNVVVSIQEKHILKNEKKNVREMNSIINLYTKLVKYFKCYCSLIFTFNLLKNQFK